jgi:hypothetical protein
VLTQLLIATGIAIICVGLGLADRVRGRAARAGGTGQAWAARADRQGWVSRSIVSGGGPADTGR